MIKQYDERLQQVDRTLLSFKSNSGTNSGPNSDPIKYRYITTFLQVDGSMARKLEFIH